MSWWSKRKKCLSWEWPLEILCSSPQRNIWELVARISSPWNNITVALSLLWRDLWSWSPATHTNRTPLTHTHPLLLPHTHTFHPSIVSCQRPIFPIFSILLFISLMCMATSFMAFLAATMWGWSGWSSLVYLSSSWYIKYRDKTFTITLQVRWVYSIWAAFG